MAYIVEGNRQEEAPDHIDEEVYQTEKERELAKKIQQAINDDLKKKKKEIQSGKRYPEYYEDDDFPC